MKKRIMSLILAAALCMSCLPTAAFASDLLRCCREGYALGFRTFVMQGGEDGYFTDERLCALLRTVKKEHPDCAVTLSLGERSRESYARLREAGAEGIIEYALNKVI